MINNILLENQEGIIGSVLTLTEFDDQEVFFKKIANIPIAAFKDWGCQQIFKAILELSGELIDITTLCTKLHSNGVLEKITPEYIAYIVANTHTSAHIDKYINYVVGTYISNGLNNMGQFLSRENKLESHFDVAIDKVEEFRNIWSLVKGLDPEKIKNINNLSFDLDAYFNKEYILYTWGNEYLDMALNPPMAGNYIQLAGETGAGKSFLTLNAAESNARNGVKSVYVSYEMTREDLFTQVVHARSGTDEMDVIRKTISERDQNIFAENMCNFIDSGIDIIGKEELKELGIGDSVTKLKAHITKNGYEFVVIDSFSKVTTPLLSKMKILDAQVCMSQFILDWSRETNACIVVINHFNKAGDIAGSQKVEDDSDLTLKLSLENQETGKHIVRLQTGKKRKYNYFNSTAIGENGRFEFSGI